MSVKHFILEADKGLRSPVYLLYSDTPYLLREAALIASRTIPEEEKGFGFSSFDFGGIEGKQSFDQVSDVLNTMPFMGGRKIVVVENVQELPKKEMERLERYVDDPAPHAVLILLLKGNLKAQFREISKKVKTVPLDIRPQDFPVWIREKARQKGFTMTDGAVEFLLGSVGPDVGLISSELEKFVLIGKNRIEREDIAEILGGGAGYSVFDLVDAIKDKDRGRVFMIARSLQESADSYGLLGAINWHYSRMASQERGRAVYYDKVFGLLNEADIGIKTSGGNFPLEYLFARLLEL